MRRIVVALATCLPLAALAAPAGAPAGEAPEARMARMQKRMRVAFTVGWAEALDLSEAEALKARDVAARFQERRMALHKQLKEQVQVIRKAAGGDAAAQKSVDAALAKVREVRGQVVALNDEMFQALTQGFSPERKAKAALFLARFRQRAVAGMGRMRERMQEMRGPGAGGRGAGPGMGPGTGRGGAGGMGMGPDGQGMGRMAGAGMSGQSGAAGGDWLSGGDDLPEADLPMDDDPI